VRVIQSFRDLDFYCDSYQLALEVHEITLGFPSFEKLEQGSQMRRASKRIPANIAEGWGRRAKEAEFKHFLLISLGGCDEMQVHLDFARDLKYITVDRHKDLSERYESVGKRINAFHQRWKTY
jgi:four helix bundle protein